MANSASTPRADVKNLGWLVTFAGMGINLALGVLYAWSVLSKNIPPEWQWSEAGKSWPYSVACLMFALIMVPAGRMQDKIGPRVVASIGGILVGMGLIIASLSPSLPIFVLGFGVLAGAGFGFGYAAATPPAIKWFPAAKTGLVTGIVVAGFGLASVYVAPLASSLIGAYGIPTTLLAFGIGFLVVVVSLAQLLKVPPAGFVPDGSRAGAGKAVAAGDEYTPGEVLRTWQFYLLWFLFLCGAGAGLMIISKLAKLVEVQANLKLGFLLVAVLAIGNGGGRICAGMLSDRIGRSSTLLLCFLVQAVSILLLSQAAAGNFIGTVPMLVLLSMLIGANYGANLSVFPSITKDFYGLKMFGVNYGLVFTAWGIGGFLMSLYAGWVFDHTGSFAIAYYTAASMLLLAAASSFLLKAPARRVKG